MTSPQPGSLLAVDIGSVNTRALLFDVVDGAYRLVSQGAGRTTIGAPKDDVFFGILNILRDMEAASSRRLLDANKRLIRPEQADNIGIDYCLTTTSAGHPLRALLVGLYPQLDIAGLRRAIAPFGMDAVAEIHLQDGLGAHGRLNRLVHSRPQLIIVAGGTDDGARAPLLEMLSLARQALSLLPLGSRPTVVYAGNSRLTPSVREMLSQQVEVILAPNIRRADGALSLDGLRVALAEAFAAHKRRLPAFQQLAAMSDSGILPTARGIETLAAYFSRVERQAALAVDVGSARTMVTLARAGKTTSAVCSDIGLGHSAADTLERVGEAALITWLPFHPRKGELAQYALKKGLRLAHVPLDMRERYIEYALLRACLRYALAKLDESPRPSLLLLAGAALTGGSQGALNLLLLADALDCAGVMQVKVDAHGALAALGGLASVAPNAVVQLLDGGILQHAGSLIRLAGSAPIGRPALTMRMKQSNGETSEREINSGDVWHLPLAQTESVELRLQTARGVHLAGKRRLSMRLAGGRGGLLVDARLDALEQTTAMTERALLLLRWYAAASGQDHPVAIPESWLAPPED
ncbi:MAG: glutamate mutase L [Chloroflexi bacterium]|nr:glutamate mutase L [Chloroflexota bacterium]MCY4248013.1 glutamate mutase L [Chloroflexota bacterium]